MTKILIAKINTINPYDYCDKNTIEYLESVEEETYTEEMEVESITDEVIDEINNKLADKIQQDFYLGASVWLTDDNCIHIEDPDTMDNIPIEYVIKYR